MLAQLCNVGIQPPSVLLLHHPESFALICMDQHGSPTATKMGKGTGEGVSAFLGYDPELVSSLCSHAIGQNFVVAT